MFRFAGDGVSCGVPFGEGTFFPQGVSGFSEGGAPSSFPSTGSESPSVSEADFSFIFAASSASPRLSKIRRSRDAERFRCPVVPRNRPAWKERTASSRSGSLRNRGSTRCTGSRGAARPFLRRRDAVWPGREAPRSRRGKGERGCLCCRSDSGSRRGVRVPPTRQGLARQTHLLSGASVNSNEISLNFITADRPVTCMHPSHTLRKVFGADVHFFLCHLTVKAALFPVLTRLCACSGYPT